MSTDVRYAAAFGGDLDIERTSQTAKICCDAQSGIFLHRRGRVQSSDQGGARMRRREFITLLSGATAWPLVARAQQPAMPVIGFLHGQSLDGFVEPLRGFRASLREAGFAEGETASIEYRFAENEIYRLPELAADLVHRRVSVIAAFGSPAVFAAKAATTTIPIIFNMGDDPVRSGLVASFARPGGNLTGINFFSGELAAKRLELLRELVPGAARVAVLINPSAGPINEGTQRDVEAAAAAKGLQIQILNAETSREINTAFAGFVRERPDLLFVGPGGFYHARRVQITQLAARHAIPATYTTRQFIDVGGLMSSERTSRMASVRSALISAASSGAPSRGICRSSRRPNLSWSSTQRPLGCSAS
jgi:putative ABC transport system substrate-binding protein